MRIREPQIACGTKVVAVPAAVNDELVDEAEREIVKIREPGEVLRSPSMRGDGASEEAARSGPLG